ncbi:DUF3870 domain-containing protein [Kribbella sp. NPDC020789]
MDASKHMIVVGYAKVPAQTTTHGTQEFFSVSLLIEPPGSTVLAVESTAATGMAREWLSSLLVGADLAADESPYLEVVDRHYVGTAAGALKQAIKDAWRRYAGVVAGAR